MAKTKVLEVDFNKPGPSGPEMEEAIGLLCTRYGARLYFQVEIEPGAEAELQARLAKRMVRMRVTRPDQHTRGEAQEMGVPMLPALALMMCEGFES